ncbi:MAG: RNA-directed DNA polymerase [Ruminococcus sp.]|nr:RNA-directed DNA polymerase [Ruminococcus sp.]
MIDTDVLIISETLDVPVNKLYMLSNNYTSRKKHRRSKYENYHMVVIHHGIVHKKRMLSVPNAFLKTVQRRILDQYLYQLEESEYSTAYCKGKSLLDNASPHVGKECVLKLDISHFFDSIDDDMVYLVMKRLGLSVPATALLTHLCTYRAKLPQGAPTSPYIANLAMKQFDEKLGRWCSERNIAYTRYCDDMTFSGSKAAIRESRIISKVRSMMYRMGFMLNDKKTVFISSSQQQRVTGIVVNEKPVLSRTQRRAIRQEVYYCQKYGAAKSIKRRKLNISPDKYLHSLLGRIAFALQIEPDNSEMKGYFETVKNMI